MVMVILGEVYGFGEVLPLYEGQGGEESGEEETGKVHTTRVDQEG